MGRRGSGESSGKFSSFCCVCYTYALYKPRAGPANCLVLPARYDKPVLNFKSWYMLGLHTIYAVCSLYS
jgi:hypothetical protein